MTKKQKIAFSILAGVIVVQVGAGSAFMKEFKELEDKYKTLYELATYFAGKAEQANADLEEADLLNLGAMKPDGNKYWKDKQRKG